MVRRGFTLVEVMIALFILSTSMFFMSELQVKSMMRVWHGREDIDRLYLIKKYAYRMALEPKKVRRQSHQFEDPEMKLTVEPHEISKKSALAPFAKKLQLLNSSGHWSRGGKTRTLSIVTMIPLSPKEGA